MLNGGGLSGGGLSANGINLGGGTSGMAGGGGLGYSAGGNVGGLNLGALLGFVFSISNFHSRIANELIKNGHCAHRWRSWRECCWRECRYCINCPSSIKTKSI